MHTGTFGSYSSPALANGVAYFASYDGDSIWAFNARTGGKLWSYQLSSYPLSSPVVSNGVAYITSNDSNVYAFGLN